MAVENRKFSKISKWSHYLLKTRAKCKKDLGESLGVTQQAILKCFKAMGMIQKQENWVLYELKPRDAERHFFACERCFKDRIGRGFYTVL